MRILVMTGLVTLSMLATAETPDFLADKLISDGVGFVDTGYKYQGATYPKTKRIGFSFRNDNYGRGKAPGATTTENPRTIFGYQADNSGSRCIFRFNNSSGQLWDSTGYHPISNGLSGDVQLAIDYIALTASWGATDLSPIVAPSANATCAYYIGALDYMGAAQNKSVIEFKSMEVYEIDSEGAAEHLAHKYLPCYANGRPGIYDVQAKTIHPASSDGFKLSGYDIEVGVGKTLTVSSYCAAPRTLKLDAGSTLTFDGTVTMTPASAATLPAEGKIGIVLSNSSGRGSYILIDNLPANYNLSSFTLVSVPLENVGTLTKDGTRLVLTLKAKDDLPDAIAGTLTSDGSGYVNTGYKYVAGKTSRIVFNYATENYGKGTAPGPVTTKDYKTLFGYQEESSGSRWFFRYTNANKGQLFYADGNGVTAAVVANGNNEILVDYAKETVSWGGQQIVAKSPTVNAGISYFIFDSDYRGKANGYPSIIDFKEMRIYELNGDVENLEHDYVPATKSGKIGVYDRVTSSFALPEGEGAGFSVSDRAWRLVVNGEAQYASGDVSVTCSDAETPTGWVAIRTTDGAVVAKGSGATAAFTMPEAAVSVLWAHNMTIASNETKLIDSRLVCDTLTVSKDAVLSFVPGQSIYVTESIVLPQSGMVTLAMPSVRAAGAYSLIRGISAETSLAAFIVEQLPEGLTGTIERQGDCLVLRVSGTSAVELERPEWFATTLTSDGVGAIDTGYKFVKSSYPKTSRFVLDFSTTTSGKGLAPGPTTTGNPRTVFGYQSDNSGGRNIFRYSGDSTIQLWDGDTSSAHQIRTGYNGDITVTADYLESCASWKGTSFEGVTAPTADAMVSYYIFAYNQAGKAMYPSIVDFKSLRIYEVNDEGIEKAVRDYIPCVKGGLAGIYDKVSGKVTYPCGNANAFIAGGIYSASKVFGMVEQEFFHISAVSPSIVRVPEFTREDEYTFSADATVTMKSAAESVLVSVYDLESNVVSAVVHTNVKAGDVISVDVGMELGATMKLSGITPSGIEVVQSYEFAEVRGIEPVQMRQTGKRSYELLIASDVSIVAQQTLDKIEADTYNASGELIGTTAVCGAVAERAEVSVKLGSAAYKVLRMKTMGNGMILIFK